MKCLAIRLQKVLKYLINPNQSGFIKGRSITEHKRLLDDFIDLSYKHDKPGMIISIDFKKDFDSIEKETIYATFKKM